MFADSKLVLKEDVDFRVFDMKVWGEVDPGQLVLETPVATSAGLTVRGCLYVIRTSEAR